MRVLKSNLHITEDHLRTILLLSSNNDNNIVNRISLIEKLELEISSRMHDADFIGVNNDENNRHRLSRSGNQAHRINFHSRAHPCSQLSERDPVIVHCSDSEADSESESVPAGCPKSVRDRLQRVLEPQIREQVRCELSHQLREQIRHEMETQLCAQIRQELEPQLREQILREIAPQLKIQIHHELEPQLREQIRQEVLPIRQNIENEIREVDENRAWIDFLLYIIEDREVDATLDAAIVICDVCISPCMNNRPIILNCGHVFCGICIREWCNVKRVCPKCRAEIRFSRSAFGLYPTLNAI